MKSARCLVLVAVGIVLSANASSSARLQQPPAREEIIVIRQQVTALYMLYQLQATPAQLEALSKIAKTTAAQPRARKAVKVSEAVRKAMVDLRAALIANDEDNIPDLFSAFEEIMENEKVDLDDEVSLTDDARKATPDILKKLTARQIASFVADYSEEFPVPLEKIVEAFEELRKLPAKEWESERDDVAEQVGWLVGGLDQAAEKKIKGQVVDLLTRVRKLKDDEYKAKRADLEKEAQDVIGDIDPTVVIRHFVERSLAELLSNAQLPAALEARLSKSK